MHATYLPKGTTTLVLQRLIYICPSHICHSSIHMSWMLRMCPSSTHMSFLYHSHICPSSIHMSFLHTSVIPPHICHSSIHLSFLYTYVLPTYVLPLHICPSHFVKKKIPSSIRFLRPSKNEKKRRFLCLQKCDPHSILVTLGHRRSRLHKILVELAPLLHFTTPVGHKATVHPHQPESQHASFRRIMTHWICTTDNSIISGVNS